jgi:hypothetical protein
VKIWVRSGPGFHAGNEIEQWLRQVIDSNHAAAVIGCLYELCDIRRDGFAGRRHLWQREGFEDVWTFQSLSFRIAATFPGGGRAETFDFCLIGSERTAAADGGKATKTEFLDLVKWRLSVGSELEWTL